MKNNEISEYVIKVEQIDKLQQQINQNEIKHASLEKDLTSKEEENDEIKRKLLVLENQIATIEEGNNNSVYLKDRQIIYQLISYKFF